MCQRTLTTYSMETNQTDGQGQALATAGIPSLLEFYETWDGVAGTRSRRHLRIVIRLYGVS